MSKWTEERIELLKKLWKDGLTAKQIATSLGGGLTRNAVIGKAHRLKASGQLNIAGSGSAGTPAVVAKVKRTPAVKVGGALTKNKDKAKKKMPAPVYKEIPYENTGIKLADLKENMCRWPHGDPKNEDFSFCGEKAIPGLPYCEHHAKQAYMPAKKTKIEDFIKQNHVEERQDKKAASN